MKTLFTLLLSLFALCLPAQDSFSLNPLAGEEEGGNATEAQMKVKAYPEFTSLAAGDKLRVLVHVHLNDGYKAYWINSGGVNLPTEPYIANAAGEKEVVRLLKTTAPQFLYLESFGGTLFALKHDYYFLMEMTMPKDAKGSVTYSGSVFTQICDDNSCLPPEDVGDEFKLVIGERKANPAFLKALTLADKTFAQPLPKGKSVSAEKAKGGYRLIASGFGDEELYFFHESIAFKAEEQVWAKAKGGLQVYQLQKSDDVDDLPVKSMVKGVLAVGKGGQRKLYVLENLQVPTKGDSKKAEEVKTVQASTEEKQSTAMVLLLMFVGGIILNLMPCVFPVLSLKIMSFVKQGDEGKGNPVTHGLVYTLGILVSFWILAAVIIAVKAAVQSGGGEDVVWGFQLQIPGFVYFMMALFFALTLNLFGVFEFGVRMTNIDGGQSKSGYGGSFMSGILATLVATPCAGPFLGSALGATMNMSSFMQVISFSCMGLGLALPFILFPLFPGLMKKLPKPGAWMETFKKIMGFLMAFAVVYFFWNISGQVESEWTGRILGSLVGLAIALWIYGHWGTPYVAPKTKYKAWFFAALFAVASLVVGYDATLPNDKAIFARPEIKWVHFEEAKLNSLLKEGKPVFVDFTARWCGICQVNKKNAIEPTKVVKAYNKAGVIFMEGDFTKKQPKMLKFLKKFGRNSVPLYLFYDGKKGSKPVVMENELSAELMLEQLKKLEK